MYTARRRKCKKEKKEDKKRHLQTNVYHCARFSAVRNITRENISARIYICVRSSCVSSARASSFSPPRTFVDSPASWPSSSSQWDVRATTTAAVVGFKRIQILITIIIIITVQTIITISVAAVIISFAKLYTAFRPNGLTGLLAHSAKSRVSGRLDDAVPHYSSHFRTAAAPVLAFNTSKEGITGLLTKRTALLRNNYSNRNYIRIYSQKGCYGREQRAASRIWEHRVIKQFGIITRGEPFWTCY